MARSSVLVLVAAGLLAACDPAGPAVEPPPAVEPLPVNNRSQRITANSCPASNFQYLVGQPIDAAREAVDLDEDPFAVPTTDTLQPVPVTTDLPADAANPDTVLPEAPRMNVRILGPDEFVTRDFDGTRMTITTQRKGNTEVVGRIFCG